MTVRELIEVLQKHDPSAKVIQDNGLSAEYIDVACLEVRAVMPTSYKETIYEDAEPSADAIQAVLIV